MELAKFTLVLIRHGESEWNSDICNKFCGWYDAELSSLGMQEARQAGQVRYHC